MATLPPLPNPLTPFAWLPPDIANQLEAARCLYSATLGAWVWDLLMSMHEDWRVFSKGSLRLPGVVYILARMASLSFILTAFIFAVGYVDNCHALAKTIGCGRGMGKMSRTLLMSGQLYYLATVGLNIVAMAVILAPSVPPVIAAMFSIPNVALQNAMACRVYRQLKLGLIREVVTEVSASSRNNKTSIIPRFHQTSKTQPEFDQSDSESRVRTVHVEIDTKTEVAFDPLTNGHAESFELKHL
ncbi:hypothetical protein ABKN59_009509 [Abortiporus biennis]